MQTAPLISYIRDRGMPEWDVVFVSSSTAKTETDDVVEVHGLKVGLQDRSVQPRSLSRFENALLVSGDNRRVASRGVERAGLSETELKAAQDAHKDSKKSIPDRLYRAQRTRPLLMLHLLRTTTRPKDGTTGEEKRGEIHAAYGLSFPGLSSGEKELVVSYTANLIAYRELYGASDDEPDDEEVTDAP